MHSTKDVSGTVTKKRMTLVEQQSLMGVTDPSAHAKRQVAELDKTAKKSKEKRKLCNEQMEADTKELAYLEDQIKALHHKYVITKFLIRTTMSRIIIT